MNSLDYLCRLTTEEVAASKQLICFPYAGAGAMAYINWASMCGSGLDLWAVVPPGREHRLNEQPRNDMQSMVGEIANELQNCPEQSVALFGHCFGAALAFEVALRLKENASKAISHLFLSAFRAPFSPAPNHGISTLPRDRVFEYLAELGGTPTEMLQHPDYEKYFLPSLLADLIICDSYSRDPEDKLQIPITAFYGRSDERASRERMVAWAGYTDGEFSLVPVEGDHFFIKTAISNDVFSRVKATLN